MTAKTTAKVKIREDLQGGLGRFPDDGFLEAHDWFY
jgi:hypothetical protein